MQNAFVLRNGVFGEVAGRLGRFLTENPVLILRLWVAWDSKAFPRLVEVIRIHTYGSAKKMNYKIPRRVYENIPVRISRTSWHLHGEQKSIKTAPVLRRRLQSSLRFPLKTRVRFQTVPLNAPLRREDTDGSVWEALHLRSAPVNKSV